MARPPILTAPAAPVPAEDDNGTPGKPARPVGPTPSPVGTGNRPDGPVRPGANPVSTKGKDDPSATPTPATAPQQPAATPPAATKPAATAPAQTAPAAGAPAATVTPQAQQTNPSGTGIPGLNQLPAGLNPQQLMTMAPQLLSSGIQLPVSLATGLLSGIAPALMALASMRQAHGEGTPTSRDTSQSLLDAITGSGKQSTDASQNWEGSNSEGFQTDTKDQGTATQKLSELDGKVSDIVSKSGAGSKLGRDKIDQIIQRFNEQVTQLGGRLNTPEGQQQFLTALASAVSSAGTVTASTSQAAQQLAQQLLQLAQSADPTQLAGANPSAAAPGTPIAQQIATAVQSNDPNSPASKRLAALAAKQLGLPYVWGGGSLNGPTGGGFDCSGLTRYLVYQSTGGKITLPRTTYDQINQGSAVSRGQVQAGDLIFSNFSGRGPEHVQMAISPTKVVEAQTFGVPVKVSNLPSSYTARRVM